MKARKPDSVKHAEEQLDDAIGVISGSPAPQNTEPDPPALPSQSQVATLQELMAKKEANKTPDVLPDEPDVEVDIGNVTPSVINLNEEEAATSLPSSVDVNWEHKYRVLTGKYDTESKRNRDQFDSQASQIASLTNLVDSLSARAQDQPALTPEQTKNAYARYLEEDEVAEYGEDILEMQARAMKGVVEAELTPMIDAITALRQGMASIEESTSSSIDNAYWDKVEAAYPGANAINDGDPLWFDFLDGVDEQSGYSFRDIAGNAIGENNVALLVSIFQRYAAEYGTARTNTDRRTPPIKPGGSRGSSDPVDPTTKDTIILKQSDIKAFYNSVARRTFTGTPEERKEMEQLIENATSEGRVQMHA